MSADIGKGDWVECVAAHHCNHHPERCKNPCVVGKIYQVERVWLGPEEISLVGVRLPRRHTGLPTEFFRPIYRPNTDFIESLKRPAPADLVIA